MEEREVRLIFSAINSGCMLEDDIIDEERVFALIRRLVSFIQICYPYHQEGMKKFIDEGVKNEITRKYLEEIAYKWILVLGLHYDRLEKYKDYTVCKVGKTISELTSVGNNYKDAKDIFSGPNNMSDYIVAKFSIMCDLKSLHIEGFSKMMFYFIRNYSDRELIEEINELIKDDILSENFGKLSW